MPLTGKVAVVTGAAGDVGTAVIRLLRSRGAEVLAVDGDAEALARSTADLAEGVTLWVADVTDPVGVAGFVARAVELWGGIDLFFNNVDAEGPLHPIAEYPDALFDQMVGANLRAAFLGLKHVLPQMRDGGAVVNMASDLGVVGAAGLGGYVASKHGVLGLTKVAAVEGERRNIRVNAVCPSRNREVVLQDTGTEAPFGDAPAGLEVDGYESPDDLALLVAFLLSDGGPVHHRVDVLGQHRPEALEGRRSRAEGVVP